VLPEPSRRGLQPTDFFPLNGENKKGHTSVWRDAKHQNITGRKELKRRGWKEPELGLRPKGDKVKIAMAKRLRKETTMTLKWIASRLQMGSWTYVSNLLAANRSRKQR